MNKLSLVKVLKVIIVGNLKEMVKKIEEKFITSKQIFVVMVYTSLIRWSIIPELQNRVTHYDITNRVANSKKIFFLIFRVSNSMWKKL